MKTMRSVGISPRDYPAFSSFSSRAGSFQVSRLFFGEGLPELSSQVDLRPLQTKLIQKHPAVIQELTCWPGSSSVVFAPNRLGLADFLQLLQWRALQDFGDL